LGKLGAGGSFYFLEKSEYRRLKKILVGVLPVAASKAKRTSKRKRKIRNKYKRPWELASLLFSSSYSTAVIACV
jgi:hypothetical protein